MKKIIILFIVISMTMVSCDNGFEDLNVNPTASTELELNPKFAYLFLKSAGDEFEHSFTNILCAVCITLSILSIS